VRLANLGLKALLGKRGRDLRDEIAAIGFIVGVLKLATATFREVRARRFLVMGPGREGAVVEEGIAGHSERNVTAA
jgi:hypothetical protein